MPAVFDPEKLEQLLVANWTKFLDSRALLRFAVKALENTSSTPPKSLTVSRCEVNHSGFLLWLECSGLTLETTMTFSGELRLVQII